jgi:tripartite-type tricarboxylate transporter receptor subunit TctC
MPVARPDHRFHNDTFQIDFEEARKSIRLVCMLAMLLAAAAAANAQDWPTRPVTMVVPFGAGGGVDVTARILAPRLGQILGQQVVVENIGGAGGMTGSARVAKAAPDGYQFVYGNAGTHAINQTFYKHPLYNAAVDFAPAGMVTHTFFTLITRNDLPANTLPQFIAYARANQAKMQFGSAGAGSTTHMVCVMLNTAMGTSITHVPYRTTAVAMQDMIAGRIDFICEPILTAMAQIRGGSVKPIAFLGPRRTPVLPDLATADENGLPGFVVSGWGAFFFPAGTPTAIVHRLSKAASQTLDTPSVRERIEGLGYDPPPPNERTPEYMEKFIPAEIERWAAAIKAAGIGSD